MDAEHAGHAMFKVSLNKSCNGLQSCCGQPPWDTLLWSRAAPKGVTALRGPTTLTLLLQSHVPLPPRWWTLESKNAGLYRPQAWSSQFWSGDIGNHRGERHTGSDTQASPELWACLQSCRALCRAPFASTLCPLPTVPPPFALPATLNIHRDGNQYKRCWRTKAISQEALPKVRKRQGGSPIQLTHRCTTCHP